MPFVPGEARSVQRALREWPAASFRPSSQPSWTPGLASGPGASALMTRVPRTLSSHLPSSRVLPSPPRAGHPGPPCSPVDYPPLGPCPAGTGSSSLCGDCTQEPLPFTCLASLTESLVSRVRSWGSRWAAGAISTTFWCRRWMEQSLSYRCRMFPYWSPRVGGKLGSASGSAHLLDA